MVVNISNPVHALFVVAIIISNSERYTQWLSKRKRLNLEHF